MTFPSRHDCWTWAKATVWAHVAFAVSLVLVSVLAYQRHTGWAIAAGVVLLATSIYLDHAIKFERLRATYPASQAHVVIAALQVVIGGAVVVWSRSRHGQLTDIAGFIALGIAVIGAGGLVSELRFSLWWEHRRGPFVLFVAFFALAVSVIVLPSDNLIQHLLLALGLGLLGIEIYSEDYLHRRHAWGTLTVGATGVALLAVAVGVFVANGAGLQVAIVVAAVVLVVVWMAAADSWALLMVLVIASALIWAAAPRVVPRDDRLTPKRGEDYFLVLGDSYISGEGAQRYYEGTNDVQRNQDFTNGCRRSPNAWPIRLAQSGMYGIPSRVLFLACSGAEARHVRIDAPRDPSTGRQTEIGELKEYNDERVRLGLQDQKPRFVLLSLGGNDAGFGTIGATCVPPGDCAEVGGDFLDLLRGRRAGDGKKELPSLASVLDKSYADIKTVVGSDVPVIVTGYPKPITESGKCPGVLLTDHERTFVIRYVEQLNKVIESAARRAGFEYIDTMQEALVKAGNQLCDGRSPGLNFIGLNPKAGSLWDSLQPGNWFHNSLHPNEEGHAAMAVAAEDWFNTHRPLTAPVPSSGSAYQVPSEADIFGYGFIRRCDPHGDRSCDVEHDGWVNDQELKLAQAAMLPLTFAMVGAWMVAIGVVGFATEHDISTATITRRILVRLGLASSP